MVYLPTAYLYAKKCQIALNPLLQDLRKEIYVQAYSSIKFREHCNTVATSDMKRAAPRILNLFYPLSRLWEA